ncbi:MAG: DUF1772 domain-containing protein [Opitutaceae bacterium]
MDLYLTSLFLSSLLCSLVAGFLWAFACVAMPGIRRLDDLAFLEAFKAIDGVIQDRQPLFLAVWAGACVAVVVSAVLALWHLEGAHRILAVAASGLFLFGVQGPTVMVHLPLNDRLQRQDLESLDGAAREEICRQFEASWIRWNIVRAFFAVIASALLIGLALNL